MKFIISLLILLHHPHASALTRAPAGASKACTGIFSKSSLLAPWSWEDTTKERLFTPAPRSFLDRLFANGAAVVTLGGSTVSYLSPKFLRSEKVAYIGPPRSMKELTDLIADAAIPALQELSESRRVKEGRPPIVVVPCPGLAVRNEVVVLPSNFGALGGKRFPLKKYLRRALEKRAERIGIAPGLLGKAEVIVENDSLPVVAQASLGLKRGELAMVIFGGTGLGSAKIKKTGERAFEMISSEESQGLLESFPGIADLLPDAIRVGAEIAHRPFGAERPARLTLENVSGGGRMMSDLSRTHLSGAASVAFALLLPESQVPAWIVGRLDGDAAQQREAVARDLLKHPGELSEILARSAPDRALFEKLREQSSLTLKDVNMAKEQDSILADRFMNRAVYSQGVVAGALGLKFGRAPTEEPIEVPVDYVFPAQNSPKRVLKILVRMSEALHGWQGDDTVAEAQKGAEKAVQTLLNNQTYQAELRKQERIVGFSDIRVVIEPIQPNGTLHPDFWGMDAFTSSERFP